MPLVKAYELIQQGWTQLVMARDNDGIPCNPTNLNAKCWCTIGAITAAYSEEPELRKAAINKLQNKLDEDRIDPISIAEWNDAYFQEKNAVYSTLKELDI